MATDKFRALQLHDRYSDSQWDGLAISYLRHLFACCDGCGADFTLQHGMDCKKGGLVIQRHNEVRDCLGDISSEVWPSVIKEPIKKTCTAAITSPVIEPEPAIPLANVAATNNEDTTNNEVEDCDEVTPSGSKITEVSNEPLSGMEDERQITSEGVPVGELHNDIGTVFQRAKSSNAFAVAIQALSTAHKFSLLKRYHCMIISNVLWTVQPYISA
eukprot:Em0005g268a